LILVGLGLDLWAASFTAAFGVWVSALVFNKVDPASWVKLRCALPRRRSGGQFHEEGFRARQNFTAHHWLDAAKFFAFV
jgi:hypothetical protein